jgi:uncharacterized SAM-binding protein YcdF (DUF218 family)
VSVVDSLAQIVWDYHHLDHQLEPADCLILLGSHDTRVAERGAELYLAGWAPLLVCSGHLGALTSGVWQRSEADVFAEIAVSMGVPRDKILIENRSTNTGENVEFSRRLLAERGRHPRKIIAVQKPYMERRTYATFKQRWPEPQLMVTSPQLGFLEYPTEEITKDEVIHIMVGDLQRILLYGDRGWQIPQTVPPQVMDAYRSLIARGYTGRLIKHD